MCERCASRIESAITSVDRNVRSGQQRPFASIVYGGHSPFTLTGGDDRLVKITWMFPPVLVRVHS